MNHEARISKARAALGPLELDALLVTNLTNVQYLTGFTGTNGQVLLTPDGATFFSDGRYAARAAGLVQGAQISIYQNRLDEALGPLLQRASLRRVGIEAATVTLSARNDMAAHYEEVELVETEQVIEGLRRSKDDDEIAALRRAVALGDDTFEWILARLEPGRTERAIALELEMRMRSEGADAVSFDPIVGSGTLSAHIHHTPSERTLAPGDLVLLDFGCRVDGYCSDLTRTVVLGDPTDEQREVYGLVLRAQSAGIDSVAPGTGGKQVDARARAVIEEAGRAEEFGHGLGHGVGLDIHEAPRLARISQDTLEPGDVVTVEPGVYRSGWGGIRIEDCVLVTPEGHEVLGSAPKRELLAV